MKKTIISLVSLTLPAAWAAAFVPQELTVSTDLTYASEYVFRGVELADQSFQPTIELAYGDFYAGLWANLPTAQVDTEINYYGGFAFEVPGLDTFSFDLGFTVYQYPRTGSDNTHELYLGALFDVPALPELSAALYYFYDMDLGSHVGEASATYSHSLEGAGVPAALDFTAFLGVQGSSKDRSENFSYYGASVEMPYSVTEFSAVTAGVHFATAEQYTFGAGERGRNLFWTVGYSTSF